MPASNPQYGFTPAFVIPKIRGAHQNGRYFISRSGFDIACSPQYPVQAVRLSQVRDPRLAVNSSMAYSARAAEFDTRAADGQGSTSFVASTVGAAAARRQDHAAASIGADSVAFAVVACDQPKSNMASAFPVASAVCDHLGRVLARRVQGGRHHGNGIAALDCARPRNTPPDNSRALGQILERIVAAKFAAVHILPALEFEECGEIGQVDTAWSALSASR